MRAYLELAGAALALVLCWVSYTKGGEHTRTAMLAEQAERQAKAQAATDARDQSASTVATSTTSYLWGALPPIELKAYETRERVRTIYRDRPVAGQCERPDGVQAELDAARERAIAANRAVRAVADAGDPADPAAGGHGRLGAAGAGDPRDGGDQGIGIARMRAGPT